MTIATVTAKHPVQIQPLNYNTCTKIFVDQNDGTMRVPFGLDHCDHYVDIAQQRYDRWYKTNQTNASPYQSASFHTQMVGAAGELAVHLLMKKVAELVTFKHHRFLCIDPAYLDPNREGESDIIINGLRCEVKTLIWRDWVTYGPCITAAQRPRIESKADIVIWVVFNKNKQVGAVMGFTPVGEIASVPASYTGFAERQIFNHSLRYNIYSLCTDLFLDYNKYMTSQHRSNSLIDVPREFTEQYNGDYARAARVRERAVA